MLLRAAAFDGVGSSQYPGRWNERAMHVVYATSRMSLGLLEIMVQASGAPLINYDAYPFDIPDELLETFDRAALSDMLRSAEAGRAECRRHGETWRARGTTAGLIVPSAVLPDAYDFGDVNVVRSTHFIRDLRERRSPGRLRSMSISGGRRSSRLCHPRLSAGLADPRNDVDAQSLHHEVRLPRAPAPGHRVLSLPPSA